MGNRQHPRGSVRIENDTEGETGKRPDLTDSVFALRQEDLPARTVPAAAIFLTAGMGKRPNQLAH